MDLINELNVLIWKNEIKNMIMISLFYVKYDKGEV